MRPVTMMLNGAVGDAWGACFEFRDRSQGWPVETWRYSTNPQYSVIGGGRYTDDTQQAIAVAETVLSGPVTRERIAEALVRCYRRDPRQGYSRRMQGLMDRMASGEEYLSRVDASGTSNGAAMRGAPIGLLANEDAVLEAARVQASVSHDTPGGIASAQAVAMMVFGLRTGACERAGLPSFLTRRIRGEWEAPWQGRVRGDGVETARAALWAVVRHGRLEDVLGACIDYEGDVDSVATVAMSVAAFADDIDQSVPEPLLTGLEDGEFGRRFLASLDARLTGFTSRAGSSAE